MTVSRVIHQKLAACITLEGDRVGYELVACIIFLVVDFASLAVLHQEAVDQSQSG